MPNEDTLFLHALDLPPAERSAFLDQACAGDPALRARVERLIAVSEGTAGIIDQSLVDRPAAEEKPGDVIDRYTLVRRIGEGGCGVVWLAEQTEPVRRTVALKIIRLGMDTTEVIRRFEAERQALALMDHPDIARVFDAGATSTGRPFFVMEFVDGVPITTYCDEHNLSVADRLQLFARACEAIQHAHQKGIIHRDVKPSNVLVAPTGATPALKVIDFGIAKATEQRLTDATLVTQLGQFLGTPAYMSPEQSLLAGGDIDTRTDIYSLGVLLYELLAGAPPFEPKALLAAGLEGMWKQIREVDPPRPSTRLLTLTPDELRTTATRRLVDPPKLAHRIAGDLDWIVMRCLEKDRGRRYATASGLAADIARHLANEPIEARPASAGYRLAKLVRRNRLAFGAGAAIALALVAGTVVSTWQAVRANRAEHTARDEAAAANAVSEFLMDDLLRQADVFTQSTDGLVNPDLTVREALDRAAERVGERFADQPLLEARVRHAIAEAYIGVSFFEQARPQLERVMELNLQHLGPGDPRTLRTRALLTYTSATAETRAEAVQTFREIVAGFEALPVAERPLRPYVEARMGVVDQLRLLADYAAAEAAAQVLVDELRADPGPHDLLFLEALNQLGLVQQEGADPEKATVTLRETIALREVVLGPEHPQTLTTRNTLGMLLTELRHHDEGRAIMEDIVPVARRVFGEEHQTFLMILGNLAVSRRHTGDLTGAIEAAQEAIALRRRSGESDEATTAILLNNLSGYLRLAGRIDEAKAIRRELPAVFAGVFGPDHPNTLVMRANMAFDLWKDGAFAQAETEYAEVCDALGQILGEDHVSTLKLRTNLAEVRHNLGRRAEAVAGLQAVHAGFLRVEGPDGPLALDVLMRLARISFDSEPREVVEPRFLEAVATSIRRNGPTQNDTLGFQLRYAQALLDWAEPGESERYLRSLDAAAYAASDSVWLVARYPAALGEVLAAQGRYAEAIPLLRDGLADLQATQGTDARYDPAGVRAVKDRLIAAYEAIGEQAAAEALRAETP